MQAPEQETSKLQKKEYQTLQLALGFVFFAAITLISNYAPAQLKQVYKQWLLQDAAAFHTAYIGDKHLEQGEYAEAITQSMRAIYCRLTDTDMCEVQLATDLAAAKAALAVQWDDSFYEDSYQIGLDTVTTLRTTDLEAWKEFFVQKEGTLLTLTELGQGRELEILTDEELLEATQTGRNPSFIFRIEEDDSADYAQIPVVKTKNYTGSDFALTTQDPEAMIIGKTTAGEFVLERGGTRPTAEYELGSKLYWPLAWQNTPSIREADPSSNLFSYVVTSNNLHCKSFPNYDCNWMYSLVKDKDGRIYELKISIALLYYEELWQSLTAYLAQKGITEWVFADPMFESSTFSAADTIIPHQLALPERVAEDVQALPQTRFIDGTYIVLW